MFPWQLLFLFSPRRTGFTQNFIPFFFRVFCVSVANLYSFSRHREPDLHEILFPSFSVSSVFPWLNPISFIATEKRNYTKFSPFFFRAFCVSVAKSHFLYCHGETDLHGIFILLFPCLLCFRGKLLFLSLPRRNGITRNFHPSFSVPSVFPWQTFISLLPRRNGITRNFIPSFFRVFYVSVPSVFPWQLLFIFSTQRTGFTRKFYFLIFPCLRRFRGKTLFLFLPQVTGFTRNFQLSFSVSSVFPWQTFTSSPEPA